MGLSIKPEGLKFIDEQLNPFKDNPLAKKDLKEIARLLIIVLTDDSRWVKIDKSDLVKYTKNKHPKGDFELEFPDKFKGKDVNHKVKCEKGLYTVELISPSGVVKGWHSDLVHRIKAVEIVCNKQISQVLFDIGQAIINDREKKYRN